MKAKWKFFIMAAVVLSLAGCGKQEKEEGNTVTPEDIVGCLDFQYGEDGEYQAIGQDETKGVVLWSSSDHGKNWEETWTLPDQWKNSLVTEAQFTGDGGIFCVLAKDALREDVDTPEASFAYLTPKGVLEEKKLSASQERGIGREEAVGITGWIERDRMSEWTGIWKKYKRYCKGI